MVESTLTPLQVYAARDLLHWSRERLAVVAARRLLFWSQSAVRRRAAAVGLLVVLSTTVANGADAPKGCMIEAAAKIPPIPGMTIQSFSYDTIAPSTTSGPGYAKVWIYTKTANLDAIFAFTCSWNDHGLEVTAVGVQ